MGSRDLCRMLLVFRHFGDLRHMFHVVLRGDPGCVRRSMFRLGNSADVFVRRMMHDRCRFGHMTLRDLGALQGPRGELIVQH